MTRFRRVDVIRMSPVDVQYEEVALKPPQGVWLSDADSGPGAVRAGPRELLHKAVTLNSRVEREGHDNSISSTTTRPVLPATSG
ncbi:hypothetical protein BaRGS_00026403 [Batillaria attramentaria]|uniref:Uncharacterized protein n=1 Tax=Batillaria attramentaria TaxID=370345 RepID=A0ABD0K5L6_9CAEN